MTEDLMKQEGFPTAETVRKQMPKIQHNLYGTWLKKAKKNIVLSSQRDLSYCYFHLKFYFDMGGRYDFAYASMVGKEFKILNPINETSQEEAERLIYLLNKLGYEATPFVGEKPFEMNRCNLSFSGEDGDTFVGHGALGLFIRW